MILHAGAGNWLPGVGARRTPGRVMQSERCQTCVMNGGRLDLVNLVE